MMKHKNLNLKSILVLVLIVSTIAISHSIYFAWKNRPIISLESILPSPSPKSQFNALFYPTSVYSKPTDFKSYRTKLENLVIKYPSGWTITEYNAATEATSLYFNLSTDLEGIQNTRTVVNCLKSENLGLCYEASTLAELDFSIFKIKSEEIIEPEQGVCNKKDVEEKSNKTIYSCLTKGFAGEPVHRYVVYFQKDNQYYKANFRTADSLITRDLIRYIDSSF